MSTADPAGSKPKWQRHDAVVEHMEKAYVIKLSPSNEAESVYEIQEFAEETYVCKVKEV